MTQHVQVDIPDDVHKVIEMFAKRQGISLPAYLSSVIQTQAEWHIPVQSFEPLTVPKKMLAILFSMLNKQEIDKRTDQSATESRNIVLLSGSPFTIENAIGFCYKISKYFMGADAKLVQSQEKDVVSIIIRHDGRQNFSYFCAQCFVRLFNIFELKAVAVTHDFSTAFVKINIAEDETEAMKRYIEQAMEELDRTKRDATT
jgi:hypothetical protein